MPRAQQHRSPSGCRAPPAAVTAASWLLSCAELSGAAVTVGVRGHEASCASEQHAVAQLASQLKTHTVRALVQPTASPAPAAGREQGLPVTVTGRRALKRRRASRHRLFSRKHTSTVTRRNLLHPAPQWHQRAAGRHPEPKAELAPPTARCQPSALPQQLPAPRARRRHAQRRPQRAQRSRRPGGATWRTACLASRHDHLAETGARSGQPAPLVPARRSASTPSRNPPTKEQYGEASSAAPVPEAQGVEWRGRHCHLVQARSKRRRARRHAAGSARYEWCDAAQGTPSFTLRREVGAPQPVRPSPLTPLNTVAPALAVAAAAPAQRRGVLCAEPIGASAAFPPDRWRHLARRLPGKVRRPTQADAAHGRPCLGGWRATAHACHASAVQRGACSHSTQPIQTPTPQAPHLVVPALLVLLPAAAHAVAVAAHVAAALLVLGAAARHAGACGRRGEQGGRGLRQGCLGRRLAASRLAERSCRCSRACHLASTQQKHKKVCSKALTVVVLGVEGGTSLQHLGFRPHHGLLLCHQALYRLLDCRRGREDSAGEANA